MPWAKVPRPPFVLALAASNTLKVPLLERMKACSTPAASPVHGSARDLRARGYIHEVKSARLGCVLQIEALRLRHGRARAFDSLELLAQGQALLLIRGPNRLAIDLIGNIGHSMVDESSYNLLVLQ